MFALRQREEQVDGGVSVISGHARETVALPLPEVPEAAARRSLRAQIARLERELSALVADGFPHIPPLPGGPVRDAAGPGLLDLAALERCRDGLAARLQDLRRAARARAARERQAHEQLERMRLEPGRYRFVKLPVRDLGQGGCGVWQVRPRLGLIGMLAGWWELKLSSGCPLARPARAARGGGTPASGPPRARAADAP
jgi:hypothetical protein